MILTCPACATSYVIKDGAIPPQGRQVRCASCKHSWHQDAEPGGEAPVAAPLPTMEQAAPAVDEAAAGPMVEVIDVPLPVSEPVEAVSEYGPEEEPAIVAPSPVAANELPVAAATAPAAATEDFSGWIDDDASEMAVKPRRKWPLLLLLLVALVAALAAAAWFLAPREWMARAGLREAAANSPLKLMVTSQDRQKLASGNDLVSLSGRVINPTEETVAVPPLQADLRDGQGKLVYSWTIAPPAPRLPPRGSATFNAAELGVPANATSLTLRWAG